MPERSVSPPDFTAPGNRFILEREFALSFLTGELGELVSGFTLSGADHLESFDNQFQKTAASYGCSWRRAGYLEGQVGTEVDNETMSMERFFELYDEYGYIPSDEGKKIIVPEEWIRRVRILLGRSKKSAIKLSVFDIPGIEDLLDEEIVNESVQEFRDALRGPSEPLRICATGAGHTCDTQTVSERRLFLASLSVCSKNRLLSRR